MNFNIKIFCTTTVTETIEVRGLRKCISNKVGNYLFLCKADNPSEQSSEGEKEFLSLVAPGKASTRIDPCSLMVGNVIGEGSFGVVYIGMYQNSYRVAIKKVRHMQRNNV